jgi:hypothetical protein
MSGTGGRSAEVVLGVLLATVCGAAGVRAQAEEPATVEERVEVREVGVVADLPARLRGMTARELSRRLRVLEDGIERTPVSVAALGGEGIDAYGRVLVVFDLARCSEQILRGAAAALGSEAARLTALGPVEIRLAEESFAFALPPTRSNL